jgi:glycosyltransferase involved in cell wall biosynthesis
MKILYHHRTRATDAQRIHINEMIDAFRLTGNEVEEVSLVSATAEQQDVAGEAREAGWKSAIKRIPGIYDLAQLGYNFIGLPLILRRILAGRPNLIYERYALFNFAGVLAARLCRIPIVLEVNSPLALENQREQETGSYGLALRAERAICNLATRVIVVSNPLRRILGNSGVRPEKTIVMPNGVNLGRFTMSSGSKREELGLSGQTVVGFVGWFRPWHGLDKLIESFAAAGVRDEAVVLLVGDGPALPGLKDLVKRLDLEDAVRFTGPVPHGEIPDYLGVFDIALQPAANEYACPMKILEYMAMGKAILAPRQENIEELLRDGTEAVLFDSDDRESMSRGLQSLVRDDEHRRQLGAAARAAIDDRGYLWTENARRVVDLLDG